MDLVQDIHAYDSDKELREYTNGVHQDYSYTETITMLPFKLLTKSP